MIKVRELHKYYGDQHLFKGIDLDVKKGDVVVLIGPSGSGKSTFKADARPENSSRGLL